MSEIIGRGDRFSLAPDLEVTQVPDGTMIYQNAAERVHYLNPTATVVFELCGMGKSVEEIEIFIADGFGLSERPAEAVRACLTSLISEGLVVRATAEA